jgi:hypothetical protein
MSMNAVSDQLLTVRLGTIFSPCRTLHSACQSIHHGNQPNGTKNQSNRSKKIWSNQEALVVRNDPSKPSNGTCGLLSLPAELRMMIWDKVVLEEFPIVVDPDQLLRKEPGILRVNLQIRSETAPTFYNKNIFCKRLSPRDSYALHKWEHPLYQKNNPFNASNKSFLGPAVTTKERDRCRDKILELAKLVLELDVVPLYRYDFNYWFHREAYQALQLACLLRGARIRWKAWSQKLLQSQLRYGH